MATLGVRVNEVATSISTPNVAKVGLPYFAGSAPVYAAASGVKVNVPVLCTSWDEAVSKLGFSYDWKKYPLCEAMYSHFQLFGCQPAIFCNVFDPKTMHKGVQTASYALDGDGQALLPAGTLLSALKVVRPKVEIGDQKVKVRPNGPTKSGSPNFDYAASYEKAGVKFEDNGIFYTPGGELDEKLKHHGDGDRYYVGIVFPKPDTARSVTSKINGKDGDTNLELSKDGEFVLNGEYISYFAFADAEGNAMPDAQWKMELTWTLADETTVTTSCTICRGMGNHCVENVDYTAWYDEDDGSAYVQITEDGALADEEALLCETDTADPEQVEVADIVEGVGQVDAAMTVVGQVPDLICAPGWSSNTVVAAVMATKAAAISGLFKGKAVIDIDSSEEGVTEYSQLSGYKNQNNFVDVDQIACWPQVKLGDYQFHLSTQLCGLMAKVDTDNRGIPYESPSNKNLKMDTCCLADGTEVNLTWPQVEMVSGDWGIVTAVNFMDSGWVAKGNYTACFPANTDVKDQFIPVSRMFDFIGNTLIRTFWSKQDKPLTPALRDNILQTCNIWLGGLCGSGYLYGARCELLAAENPLTNLLAGHITLHVYNAPPVPAQFIEFLLEYDVSYMETALTM